VGGLACRAARLAAPFIDLEIPLRQWVLTLPYPLRYRCAWDARLTSEVLRAFLRALFADQRRSARRHYGVRNGHCGAVTAIQRFGSALNLAPHFHSLILDGVYPGPAHAPGMRLLAAITDPVVAERILVCMDLPARAPPLKPADSSYALANFRLQD
jgi:hypothetical protein